MEETPNEKFIRIAEFRINKILDGYRLLTNLKSSSYKSTTEQRYKMFQILRQGLEELECTFAGEKPNKDKFKFNKSDFDATEERL